MTVPAAVYPGDYYLVACADVAEAVYEPDEVLAAFENNCVKGPLVAVAYPDRDGDGYRADQTAKPLSKDFQLKHGIGPSSSIKASLDSLVKKGILFKTLQGSYQFVDGFMPYWTDSIRKTIR